MRRGLLLRLMLKAAWVRKDRALTALLSIMVVATMATVALTLYSDLQGEFSREFRGFGPNAIITARHGGLNNNELAQIKTILGDKSEVVPVGYAVVMDDSGRRLVVGGADLPAFRRLNSFWSFDAVGPQYQVTGSTPWIGARVRNGQPRNQTFYEIAYADRIFDVPVVLQFKSGSDDDSRVYLNLEDFERLTGVQPNTAQLRIDGPPDAVERQIAKLGASLPELEVKPVRLVAAAETAVLGKTRSIVLAASVVVVVLIVVCMVATLTGAVLERRKDFAVMKALGASNRTVNLLFAGESAIVSAVGAILGFVSGTAIAFWIGRANFGAALSPRPELLGPVVLGSILLALVASTAPLNLLRRIQPAGILRGE